MHWALILLLTAAMFVAPDAAHCNTHGKPTDISVSRGPDMSDTGNATEPDISHTSPDIPDTGSWTTARQSINAVTGAVLAKLRVNG